MLRLLFSNFLNTLIFFFLISLNAGNASEKEIFETPRILNTYGMPGAIDNPTAEAFPEGQFSVSSSTFGGTIRTNLSFQVTNNVTVSFRYSRIPSSSGDHEGYFWDRSFDFHYLFNEQTNYIPSIAIGLRDFIGTGLYTGEYLVATKNITKNIKASGGLGWGRLSGTNKQSNIFGFGNERASISTGFGGTLHTNHFFLVPTPLFLCPISHAGFEIITEISSDDYGMEVSTSKGFIRKSDLNFAIKYNITSDFSIMGKFMHGNAIGVSGVLAVNPRNSPYGSGMSLPQCLLKDSAIIKSQSFMDNDIFLGQGSYLNLDGIILLSIEIDDQVLDAEILDRNYQDVSQMIGRTTRILSKTVPVSVKMFKISLIDYQAGYSISKVTVKRESLRDFELMFDGPNKLWENVQIDNSPSGINSFLTLSKKSINWSLYPDIDIMLFDPHFPINGSIGWKPSYLIDCETLPP